MNELSRHIEILLLDNDCVIVPGFGGFVAHHCFSVYQEKEETFCPPKRTLGFNPQLQLNDSLLVQSYVEAYDISYPEAIQRLESDVEDVKQTIDMKGYYEFSGIGTVCKMSDGRYSFEPCTAGLVTPSLYALNSYVIGAKKVSEETEEMTLQPAQPNAVEAKGNAVADNATLKVVTVEEAEDTEDEFEEDTISIRVKTIKRIAAAAAILLVFVLTCMPLGKGSGGALRSSVVDTEFIGKLMNNETARQIVTDTVTVKKDTVAVDSIKTKTDKELAPEDEIAEKTSNAPYYSIVMASKVSSKGAKALVASMNKSGYTKATIYEKGSMRRVIYGVYETEGKATAALRKLRRKDSRFDETWVQKMN